MWALAIGLVIVGAVAFGYYYLYGPVRRRINARSYTHTHTQSVSLRVAQSATAW